MSNNILGPLNKSEVMMQIFDGIDQTTRTLSFIDTFQDFYTAVIAHNKPTYVPSFEELSALGDESVSVCNELIKSVGGIAISSSNDEKPNFKAKVIGISGFVSGNFIYTCKPPGSNALFNYPLETASLVQMHFEATLHD